MSRYPQVSEWQETSTETYPYSSPCMKCGHKHIKGERFLRRETQVSYFRGDDEVETICESCKRGPSGGRK